MAEWRMALDFSVSTMNHCGTELEKLIRRIANGKETRLMDKYT